MKKNQNFPCQGPGGGVGMDSGYGGTARTGANGNGVTRNMRGSASNGRVTGQRTR